jgi:alpha-1,2-mannosyltransferase
MTTIDPTLCGDAMPPLKTPGPLAAGSRREFWLLRIGELLALIAFLSFGVMWVQWQTTSPGFPNIAGDFVSFWTAGHLALEGRAADAYREVPHYAAQLALHGDPRRAYVAFFYPPFFLLPCVGLALLSYFPALCVWLGTTCACYAAALRGLLPKTLRQGAHVWVLFLGYPAVMVNAGFGQNGYLSAALFGGAAVWLDRRPELAGLCLGALAYKPQLGIVVPLALAAAGRWRCFAAACATVLVLAALATLAFGPDIWPPFFADVAVAKHKWMEAPDISYLRFWITVYGALRLHGASLPLAYAAQAAVTLAAVSMLVSVLLKRPQGARSGRAEVAALAACVPFCSPFMLEYDLVILAVPMAWLLGEALRDGFRRGEGVALVGAYLAPALFKVTAFDNALKLSVIVASALLFLLVLRRMMHSPAQGSVAVEPAHEGRTLARVCR